MGSPRGDDGFGFRLRRLGYAGSYVNANDYRDGAGAIVESTFYESENHALQLATRHGNHLVTLDAGYQDIPNKDLLMPSWI